MQRFQLLILPKHVAKQVAFSNAYYDSSAEVMLLLKGKADLASAKTVGVQKWNNVPTIYCSRNQAI